MRQWTAGFLTTIAALAGAATAQAAAIPASTLVGDFNAIIENNFFTTSDTEGNVLIGANRLLAPVQARVNRRFVDGACGPRAHPL